MIDFHSHILPAIDDGSSDIATSVKMLKSLKKQSINKVVFTPHYIANQMSIDEFIEKRNNSFTLINDVSKQLDMEFFLGAEVYLMPQLLNNETEDLKKLCISNSDYILTEMPFDSKWNSKTIDLLENIIYNHKLIPIIAHIERYPAIKDIDLINEFIAMGCLIQVNTESLISGNLKKFTRFLFENEYAHILGSDCHNLKTRPPVFSKPIQKLTKHIGQLGINNIINNGQNIINNMKPKLDFNQNLLL